MFYKLKYLSEQGHRIHLHTFGYNHRNTPENINALKPFCKSIEIYPRKSAFCAFFSRYPYIIISRYNKTLLRNLRKDSAPILFEGLHTTYYLKFKDIQQRSTIVRSHNIEHSYYRHLGYSTKNPIKKLYFFSESIKLFFFKHILSKAGAVAAITQNDKEEITSINPNTFYLPPFFSFQADTSIEDEPYILYHGNLSVPENEKAVLWLINNVFSKTTTIRIVIAGMLPHKRLYEATKKYKHIEIVDSPSNKKMEDLIRRARINLLYSFQNTGIKLKLLHVLFSGKHCIVNTKIVQNTNLSELCIVADKPSEISYAIKSLFPIPFLPERKQERLKTLYQTFDFEKETKKLIEVFLSLSEA